MIQNIAGSGPVVGTLALTLTAQAQFNRLSARNGHLRISAWSINPLKVHCLPHGGLAERETTNSLGV